jgi:hypothetical protein
MAGRKYPWEKAIQRLYRKLRGDTIDPDVSELDGEFLGFNESWSGITELFQQSGDENLHFPPFVLPNATTIPSGSLKALAGVLYCQNGSLMWLGASGTISTVAGS